MENVSILIDNITKGVWVVSSNKNQGLRILVNPEDNLKTINICSVSGNPSEEDTEANAQLIAETGTIANQCGLTPAQLLEQRNMLVEACKALVNCMDNINRDLTEKEILAIDKAQSALTQATNKK